MKNEKIKLKLFLFFLVIILFGINYPILDKALRNFVEDYEIGFVERVIDGDTIEINNTSVRLLGINTPEKGEKYYEEAKEYLENLTLNKLVKMKKGKEDIDLYKRKLRYIFIEDINVNLELVKTGLANFYFPSGKDNYYKDFKEAWEECVINRINLCEKSSKICSVCVKLKSLNVNKQELILKNECEESCDLSGWTIKDEGRKKFEFVNFVLDGEVSVIVGEGKDTNNTLFWTKEDYVWTETGDSIFLRDDDGKLVFWWGY